MKAKPAPQALGSIRERVRADGTSSFQFRWYDDEPNGTRTQQSESFASRDAAEDFQRQTERKIRDGTYKHPKITVSDLIAEYIERSAGRVSPRSIKIYSNFKRTMIDPLIGPKLVRDLETIDLQRWIQRLGKAGYASSTISNCRSLLRAAFKEAHALDVIERDLSRAVRGPTIQTAPVIFWNEEQVKAVLKAIREDERFGALYYLAIATGMRPGKLRALQWPDVDLERGIIHVRRTISTDADGLELIVERTKTKKNREIAITPATVERLRWHRAQQRKRQIAHPAWHDTKLVFDRGDGRWIYNNLWYRLRVKLHQETGVPLNRGHDLRHSSASLELVMGTNPKIVAERMGHSVEMLQKTYTHVTAELQREAADKFSRRMLEDVVNE